MASIDLDTPVQFVRGVGPARAAQFESLGILTVGHLIEHVPFRYETVPSSVPIGDLKLDETATVVGGIRSIRQRHARGGPNVEIAVVDATGIAHARWFNAPYVRDRVSEGRTIRITGKVDVYRDTAQFTNPQFEIIDDDADPLANDHERFEPVYRATAQLSSKTIARIVAEVLTRIGESIREPLPEELCQLRRLAPKPEAIIRLHRPTDSKEIHRARERLAYEEFLFSQLAVQGLRIHRQSYLHAKPVQVSSRIDERIRRRFPFKLTPGQNDAVQQIVDDLARSRPMNRLLQGDVASGKTAVAVYAALAAIANRCQVAFVTPTEILARQHYESLNRYLAGSRVRNGLLVGKTPAATRRRLLDDVASGAIDLLVATHAIVERDVRFKSLGLVIIDEQHKFGVAQRAAAKLKGESPHCLVMTATPIPRTLAMTVFGDLDVSSIRDAPPGRCAVHTKAIRAHRADDVWNDVVQQVVRGRQAYVVYPLVDESDTMELKAATTEFERLRLGPFANLKVGLLHGRLSSQDKERTMAGFRSGGTQVLIATTVIEVGLDVPNATVMVIEHADRFGLSQLHQLRGRVGRGGHESHCYLLYDGFGEQAMQRLKILCQTNDGFRIAEEDLHIRGPGELLGRRQHGMPEFKLADLVHDLDLLMAARDDAAAILANDPRLRRPEHASLRHEFHRRYRDVLQFANVA